MTSPSFITQGKVIHMTLSSTDFTLIRILKTTHDSLQAAACERGMKLWTLADRALASYLEKGGRE